MATPRYAGPPGAPKQKFGKLSAQTKKLSGPQPPIKAKAPARPSVGKGRPLTKPGAPKAGP